MSIMDDVFKRDTHISNITDNMQESFDYFRGLLLKHCVQRPPKRYFNKYQLYSLPYMIVISFHHIFASIQIFDKEDVPSIVDYAIDRCRCITKFLFHSETAIFLFSFQLFSTIPSIQIHFHE